MSVTDIADMSHVSKPTVVRFCRSIGYDGLTDFKQKLIGSINEGVPFVHRSVDTDDKINDILVKVLDNAVASFLKYRGEARSHSIEQAVSLLVAAHKSNKRIQFYGVGNSGIVAQDAQHKFFRFGVDAAAINDGHMQIMGASVMNLGDCLVIISNSGRTKDLIEACDIARKNGAETIVITASNSPLSQCGKVHLAADHTEGFDDYSPMASRLLHLLIIDVIATAFALKVGIGNLQPKLKEMKSNLRAKRYS
jgi:RpiR family carbohydrate utilization transcriptional regulator